MHEPVVHHELNPGRGQQIEDRRRLELVARHQLAADDARVRVSAGWPCPGTLLERNVAAEPPAAAAHRRVLQVVVASHRSCAPRAARDRDSAESPASSSGGSSVSCRFFARSSLRISTSRGIASSRGSLYQGRRLCRNFPIRPKRFSGIGFSVRDVSRVNRVATMERLTFEGATLLSARVGGKARTAAAHAILKHSHTISLQESSAILPATPFHAARMTASSQPECEYLVVGSGAGGGTVAARLAEAGKHVMLLEAGGDPRSLSTSGDAGPADDRIAFRHDYDVPAFHAFASENIRPSPGISSCGTTTTRCCSVATRSSSAIATGRAWTASSTRARATLGGCTAHNAMILVYPHNADWDHIAEITGDASWSSANMRSYFERIENCRHRPAHRWLAKLGLNPTRHGWNGWLPTEKAIPKAAMADRRLARVMHRLRSRRLSRGRRPVQTGALVSERLARSE